MLSAILPTRAWLCFTCFGMPGKRSYINAKPGCLTTQQLHRQARDLAYTSPPPPPPPGTRSKAPWADFEDNDCGFLQFEAPTIGSDFSCQCDLPADLHPPLAPPAPPQSGQALELLGQALNIITLQCAPERSKPIFQPLTLEKLIAPPLSESRISALESEAQRT